MRGQDGGASRYMKSPHGRGKVLSRKRLRRIFVASRWRKILVSATVCTREDPPLSLSHINIKNHLDTLDTLDADLRSKGFPRPWSGTEPGRTWTRSPNHPLPEPSGKTLPW